MASSVVASNREALVDKLLFDMLFNRRSPVDNRLLGTSVGDSYPKVLAFVSKLLVLLTLDSLRFDVLVSAAPSAGGTPNWFDDRWLRCGLFEWLPSFLFITVRLRVSFDSKLSLLSLMRLVGGSWKLSLAAVASFLGFFKKWFRFE